MEKFALELLAVLGWPALFLCAGLLLDFICSKNFKADIAARLSKKQRIGTLRNTIRDFNSGFLAPLLGSNRFTRKFFLRSAFISIVALPAVTLAQVYIYKIRLTEAIHLNNEQECLFVVILLFTNIAIDYIANICTVSLLFMAAVSRNILDIVIVSLSNIISTLTIFSSIFPIGILICYLIHTASTPTATLQIELAGSADNMLVEPDYRKIFAVSVVKTQSASHDEDNSRNFSTIYIIQKRDQLQMPSPVEQAAELISYDASKGFVFSNSAIIESEMRSEYIDWRLFRTLYSISFDAAELIRQNFSGMVHLHPYLLASHNCIDNLVK